MELCSLSVMRMLQLRRSATAAALVMPQVWQRKVCFNNSDIVLSHRAADKTVKPTINKIK